VPLAPRVVVLYFGWNDHWIGFGLEGDQIARVTGSQLFALQRSRLVPLHQRYVSIVREVGAHDDAVL
jgi:hypothetical protein